MRRRRGQRAGAWPWLCVPMCVVLDWLGHLLELPVEAGDLSVFFGQLVARLDQRDLTSARLDDGSAALPSIRPRSSDDTIRIRGAGIGAPSLMSPN